MLKAFRYRIYPDKEQNVLLEKHISACRLIYNLGLETKISAYSSGITLSRYDLQVQLKELKNDYDWLKEINSQSLQTELMNLDGAYLKFFKGLSNFPKFKKKNDKQTFQCPQNVTIKEGKICLPKFKTGIKIVQHRLFDGETRTVTISKTATNKWFASILVKSNSEMPIKKQINSDTAIGIDLGIKTFAVLSDGTEYENPKYLRSSLKRLKILQRRLSKKKKGSANSKKASHKVAILHEKITNQRKDFLHKFSDAITKQYDTICVENLNIAGMVKNHRLALSISDAGWAKCLFYLKYKSEWRGKTYHEIGRFDPSSKIHNTCGYLNRELTLSDREWLCPKCGENVLRDKNAAINIKNFALSYLGSERAVEPVELLTLVGTMKQEAFTLLGL